MSHIINHVRVFAREAGKPELEMVDVNEVVAAATSLLQAQFDSHGVILHVIREADLSAVLANPFSLEEVFLNLLNNARQAVEESPNRLSAVVRIQTKSTNGDAGRAGVLVEVSDNGAGIPAEILGKVFDPFFTTKGPDEGTGLGLSVSKSIVETFDGQLQIESAPGEGTVVSVRLPEAEVPAHAGTAPT
jgi:two-component system NtrC family sensor kinase